jgi:hypothetical protein
MPHRSASPSRVISSTSGTEARREFLTVAGREGAAELREQRCARAPRRGFDQCRLQVVVPAARRLVEPALERANVDLRYWPGVVRTVISTRTERDSVRLR